MAINQIQNNEQGSSVRAKLNQVISKTNDFDSLDENELFIGDENDERVKRSDVEVLRRKEILSKASANVDIDLSRVWFYDSFERPDTASGVVTSPDFGPDWQVVIGDGGTFRIDDNRLRVSVEGNAWGVPVPSQFKTDTRISGILQVRLGNTFEHSFLFMRDADNYLRIRYNTFRFEIISSVAGTETVLELQDALPADKRNFWNNGKQNFEIITGRNLRDYYISIPGVGAPFIFDIGTSVRDDIFPNDRNDLNFVAIGKIGGGDTTFQHTFKIESQV